MGDPISLFARLIVIFFAIGLHEYAHCKMADMAGDPTPRIYGRVTLNLIKHFDPMGTLMIIITSVTGFGIGWGRPAPIDPSKMRNPRWDTFFTVAAGPLSNVLQALVWGIFFRLGVSAGLVDYRDLVEMLDPSGGPVVTPPFLMVLCFFGVLINLSLAFFNLIPLGVLDGHWLVGLLLPGRARDKWFLFNRHYGWGLLIAIVVVGQVDRNLSIFRFFAPFLYKFAFTIVGLPREFVFV